MKKEGGFYNTREVKLAIEEYLFEYLVRKYQFRKSDKPNFNLGENAYVVYKNDLFIHCTIDKIDGYEIYFTNFNNPNAVSKRLNNFYRLTHKKIKDYNDFIRKEYSGHDFKQNTDYVNTKYIIQKMLSFIEKNFPEVFKKGDVSVFENT